MEVKIPFSGFYESDHDKILDDAFEGIFQNDQGDIHEYAQGQDEGERDNRLTTAYFDVDWGKVRAEYVKAYTEAFTRQLNDDLKHKGLQITLTYKAMESPREYNFTTDRIFAEISLADVKKLYRLVDKAKFSKYLKDHFTSYDGFISFYSNDLDDWVVKPFKDWDHNEVGALLETVALSEGRPSDYEAYSLMEGYRVNGHADSCIWDAMGPKVKAIAEKVTALVHGR
jgi:hypothetical protein